MLRLATGLPHDEDGHGNPALSNATVTYKQLPSVTITPVASSPGAGQIHFTVTFSDSVSDFTADDVTLSGTAPGTLTQSITGSGMNYDLAVSGLTGDGTVIATIDAGVAHNAAGDPNLASSDTTNTYDAIPTVTINQAADQADPTAATEIHFTAVFSEKVADFTAGDVTVTGTAFGDPPVAAKVTIKSTDETGTTYDVTVSSMTGDGTVIATIGAGKVHDATSNPNVASTSTDNSVTCVPGVTIDRAANQADLTNGATINFTVTFSAPVSDFATGDVTLGGNAGATTAVVTGSGTTYNVAVSGMSATGTVEASIAAGAAHDAAGNPNMPSLTNTDPVNYVAGPLVSNMAVSEAAAPYNGILESNENLKITWTATTPNRITAQFLVVDGGKFTKMGGFYGGPNYSCPIGKFSPGSHYYVIKAVDSKGISYVTEKLWFTVATPVPPTIVDKGVVEAAAPKNNILESNEKLKLSWTASSQYAIAAQTVKVDGKTIAAVINKTQSGYNCVIGPLAVGTHKYTIKSTDAKGVSSSVDGTFTVLAPVPPAIDAPTVVEVANPTSGKIEPKQNLKLTWTASSQYSIASQTVWIDDKKITKPIQHPGGSSYSCVIGAYKVGGDHKFKIKTTDAKGVSSISAGTFTVANALMVGASAAPLGSVESIGDSQLAPIVTEAISRLEAQFGSQVETALAGVKIEVTNLSGKMLGEASGKTILIDNDAAGYGWFVDSTPLDDAEFTRLASNTLTAPSGGAADQRADLLTAVMHEMGHVLGYQDVADGLMSATLPLGIRRVAVK